VNSEALGWVTLAVVVYAVAYAISIRLHPYKDCWRCQGRKKHVGSVFTYAHRNCRRCGGAGRKLRMFAKGWRR